MGRRISDTKKSEIVGLHLKGWIRDDIAKKTGVSAGGVSGVIREFTDRSDSSSLDDAAEEFNAIETVESLRELAVKVRRLGTSVEELVELASIMERVKKLVPLEKLEGFIKAGESLGDRAHVEASFKMRMIEERTGRSYDDILVGLESKETRLKELSLEIQRLNSEVKNLNSEKERVQAHFKAEKDRLEKEVEEQSKQQRVTLEEVVHVSNIKKGLIEYGVELTQLDKLQSVLKTVHGNGFDPKRIVEQVKERETLQAQIEKDAEELAEIRKSATKLSETVSALEERVKGAEAVIERYEEGGVPSSACL